jgi:hypothetical protein
MRPVKHGSNIVQGNADPGPGPWPHDRAERNEQHFNIPPRDIRPDGIHENGLQRSAMLRVHIDMISGSDTMVKKKT